MNPDDPLLRILVCPLDKGPLRLVTSGAGPAGDALYNPRLRRLYPVVNGVPHLRPASGARVSDEDHARLTREAGAAPPPENGPAHHRA
ncbi:Trm112 family protein [Streptomyces sp. CAU 1734]|uniref:Trm112 family protein n=1 Tax=Streptomyces sp. CAU 1734 TaxID=3140360 RepID=UPI0032618BF5